MNPDEYTDAVLQALGQAQRICVNRKQQAIGIPQLFKYLIQPGNLNRQIYAQLGLNLKDLDNELNHELDSTPTVSGSNTQYGHTISMQMASLLQKADSVKKKLGDKYVAIDTLALALMKVDSPLTDYLKQHGVTYEKMLKVVKKIRGGAKIVSKNQEDTYNALKRFGTDLTKEAKEGKLPPVIGRSNEIITLMEILLRTVKNNPLLLGKAGVGKTAIVEGLAEKIAKNEVPNALKGKHIFELNLTSLMAGTQYRGSFEARIHSIIKAINKSHGKIIMFIDEIHEIMGTQANSQSSTSVGNLLKPALSRSGKDGGISVIGATTWHDYHKYMSNDNALTRRFQQINIKEPSAEDTITILRGIKSRFEIHHNVRIHDAALVVAVKLTNRFITDKQQPDKSIDVLDLASSALELQTSSRPKSLIDASHKLIQYKVERTALKNETDEASKNKLKELEPKIANVQEKVNNLNARWQREKKVINHVSKIRKSIQQARNDLKQAESQYDYNTAAIIKHGKLPKLQKELANIKSHGNSKDWLVSPSVTSQSIAKVLADETGIPVERLTATKKQALINLPQKIHKRVIGQDKAVNAVSRAVIRGQSGISDPTKPIASFLFLGSTGVGKTELAKTMAQDIFGNENQIIRIDSSEYQSRASISRLIGSSPGLVGSENGGILTNAVHRRPYSIVLFDEIEKANPAIYRLLLQILDDGRLTDNRGLTVNFRNTIIIMTSNLGSEQILNGTKNGKISDKARKAVKNLLVAEFKPEFLNRIDDKILFEPLTIDNVKGIVSKFIRELNNRLADKYMTIKLTQKARDYIAKNGYSEQYGARPLARYITRFIENPIARDLILDKVKPHDTVNVDVGGFGEKEHLKFKISK